MERKKFRVYQSSQKYISNSLQLQTILKKNPKTLRNLEYKGISPRDGRVNAVTTESPNLGSLAKLLKKNKSISSVNLQIQNSRLDNFQKIFLALRNLQSLSTLHLYSPRSRSIIHKAFQSFSLCTKNLKQLKNLDCDLYDMIKVAKHQQALHYIASFRPLSHLTLRLFSDNWVNAKAWRSFSYELPFLTSLTFINLAINFYDNFKEKSVLQLFSVFSKLPNLTSLDFTLVGCESPDFPILMFLFENLKDLPHFQDLALHLDTCRGLKSERQDLLATGLALLNPKSFRKLCLEFYTGFNDSDLSKLLVVLQRFSALTHLALEFSDSDQVTAEGLSGLPATLLHFPALKSLKLPISYLINTGSFFEMISPCLENLKGLVSFSTNTWQCDKIDNLGIQRLCSQLPHLSKLENLDLRFGRNSRLDGKCIESISEALRNLVGLKSLSLGWKSDGNIGDEVFEDLIESLGFLKHLRDLYIEGLIKVNKETFEALGVSVKSLESLNDLFIGFEVDSEKEAGNFGENFDSFVGLLENMSPLTDISLIFHGFGFSEKSRNIVAKSLKNFRLVG